jgi:hypothetical protein
MAIQKNTTAIGEYTASKNISISSGFLDVFIGSANFKSICGTMHIRYQEPKIKVKKK